ncbi:hypothetical protein M407DRAFT_18201 [Tulasnella calospora MUT 4182]|uniref:Tyrosinase C-terminal domain-containing protein n=1 Tax=Tulasnella calospora MUT 4182 TaxID=1051891 RepID=A0A0C3QVM6_9AGAM|nr:hypothetical protein M407DRAFT_18201 [Tulasnella calospora MUT 4182]
MTTQSVINPPGTKTGYDWTARIRCIESELGTNFSVFVFLGPLPKPPANPITSPNYVGSFDTYFDNISYSTAESRSQGGSSGGVLVQGFVNLSRALVKLGGFQTLEPENVVPYLKSNLNWCAQKSDGDPVDLHDLPSLEVMVLEVPMTLKPGDRIPQRGSPKEHADITHGKQGGAK